MSASKRWFRLAAQRVVLKSKSTAPCIRFGTGDPSGSNLQVSKPARSSYPDAAEEVVDSERKDFCTYLPPRNIDYTEEKERKNLDIAFYNELRAQERYYRTIGYQMLNRLDDKALTLSSSVELSSKWCQTNRHAIASEIGKLSLEFNRCDAKITLFQPNARIAKKHSKLIQCGFFLLRVFGPSGPEPMIFHFLRK
ncbi:hypothetical protein B0H13DRAFT_1902068 [Mycena leptocephala]|nr:hypothetical protein B0H13DRAFT_1902068 [Mycena leptocephala]